MSSELTWEQEQDINDYLQWQADEAWKMHKGEAMKGRAGCNQCGWTGELRTAVYVKATNEVLWRCPECNARLPLSNERTPELKPCPFCGGEAEVQSYEHPDVKTFFWVACKQCQADTPLQTIDTDTSESVVAWWNTRV